MVTNGNILDGVALPPDAGAVRGPAFGPELMEWDVDEAAYGDFGPCILGEQGFPAG